ncbi:MAG TPA: hypothetical protein VGE29_03685, partial [Prosthecobacter sp.]
MFPARLFPARISRAGALAALMFVSGWAQTPNPEAPPKPPVPPAPGQEGRATIPDDLLGDEHIREEFGVNQFTTPSIRKLFEMLDGLGKLSYDALKRPISRQTPS